MEPILISKYGEYLQPYSHVEENSLLYYNLGTHHPHCNGSIDLRLISESHNAIVCRECNFRLVIHNAVKTFGDLRKLLEPFTFGGEIPESIYTTSRYTQQLQAEKSALEKMIAETPESNVIDRLSLEVRKKEIEQLLKNVIPEQDICLPGSCPHEGKVECPGTQTGLVCDRDKTGMLCGEDAGDKGGVIPFPFDKPKGE